MNKYFFSFEMDNVNKLREAMNDKINISLNKKNVYEKGNFSYQSWGRMCATMDRIEDTLNYINKTPLGDRDLSIAFDFYEFLNNMYVVIECIKTMALIFEVKEDKIESIENTREIFCKEASDSDYFSYIRSLVAVHPVGTTWKHHKAIMKESYIDSCPRVVWTNKLFGREDTGDLTVQIYGSKEGDYHSWETLNILDFTNYLNKWVDFIPEIVDSIYNYNEAQYNILRSTPIKTLEDYDNDEIKYLKYLKEENNKRFGNEQDYIFDFYINVFRIALSNQNNIILLEKYKNSIRRSMFYLRNELQNMSTKGYENTGLLTSPNFETDLFIELHSPSVWCENSFSGYHYHIGKLCFLEDTADFGERNYTRFLLNEIKTIINKFVYFTNDESDEETVVLVRLALYLNALECDCLLNRSIPNDEKYRLKKLTKVEYEQLQKPDDVFFQKPISDFSKELFE